MQNQQTAQSASKKKSFVLHLAHHPTCYRHDHHLIRIFQNDLCLGCTCGLSGGLISAIVYYALLSSNLSIHLLFYSLLFLIPTVIQPFYQKKWFKMTSRTMLGFASAIYLLTTLHLFPYDLYGFFYQFLALLFMYSMSKILSRWRNTKTPNPCQNCPHGKYPMCDHVLDLGEDDLLLIAQRPDGVHAVPIPQAFKRRRDVDVCQRKI